MNPTLIKALIAGGLLSTGAAVKYFWKSYPDDNVFEEVAEEYVLDEFDVDIDITPDSKEK